MGHQLFEPMVLLTNAIIFGICFFAHKSLQQYDVKYAKQMGLFLLLMGISTFVGAIGHVVHFQLGTSFFNVVLYLMNIFSMVAVYYCFRAPFEYTLDGSAGKKYYVNLVRIWVVLLFMIAISRGDFLVIKVNAGLVLLYSLIAHLKAHRTKEEGGNLLVVYGILLSFVPIVIHTLKISLHEWFNYKDLSHVVMIFSLLLIIRGVKMNAEDMQEQTFQQDTLKL